MKVVKDIRCPICSSDNAGVRDADLGIYSCCLCDHVFGIVPDEKREQYDQEYFLRSHKNYFENPDRRMFDLIYKEAVKFSDECDLSILDAGCGQGAFLKHILDKGAGFRLCGIDLIPNNHPGIDFITGDVLTADIGKDYDMVFSLAAIEHVDDPALFLGRVKEALRPGGIISIMTIDDDSLIFRIARLLKRMGISEPYRRFYDSHNLQYFTRSSLKKLIQSADMEILFHRGHNYSLKAVDVPSTSPFITAIYRFATAIIFSVSSFMRLEVLQTIVCRKRAG